MNTCLSIDTSGPSLSVALVRAGTPVFACVTQNGLTHSDGLMPMVDAALQAGRMEPSDVELFAAVTGPGSFTGVRIGVETIKALSHATGRPCIGVNALLALSLNAQLFEGTVCALQDARAGQVYCAAFRHGEQVYADAAMKLSDFLGAVKSMGRCCFVGDGALAHKDAISAEMGENALFAPFGAMCIHADQAAFWALNHRERASTWQALLPYYLRAPQAEREREAKAHA